MPTLVNGMEQTTGQELDDFQRAIEASLAVENDVQAQNEVERADFDHAIKESSAQIEATAEQERNDNSMKGILIGLPRSPAQIIRLRSLSHSL